MVIAVILVVNGLGCLILSGKSYRQDSERFAISDEFSQLEYKPGCLLVKIKEGIDISTSEKLYVVIQNITESDPLFGAVLTVGHIFKDINMNRVKKREFGLNRWVRVDFGNPDDLIDKLERWKSHPLVEDAQLNYRLSVYLEPNDPYYHSSGSWGQDYSDLWGMHRISASSAWDVSTGSQDVIVGVIDTGVDYTHQDINDNMWINEDDPINGIDDDSDGFIDNIYGADFAYDDSDPMDMHGHGTHCAGTIGAVGNNSLGVVGVNWQVRIMAIQGLDRWGWGYTDGLAAALAWAADQGANVLSNSWGCPVRSPVNPIIENGVRYAYNLGCAVVFAAGNSDDDAQYYSPQNMDETITVAATDHNDQKTSFSNWGEKIDVCAPGGDSSSEGTMGRNILSLRAHDTDMYEDGISIVDEYYYRARGTSMACPHVAGLAALILSKNPDLHPAIIKSVLVATADDISQPLIGGRINASAALRCNPAYAYLDDFPDWTDFKGTVQINGSASGEQFQYYIVEYGKGKIPSEWIELANVSTPVFHGNLASWDTTTVDDGRYTVRLRVISDFNYKYKKPAVINNHYDQLIVDKEGTPGAYANISEAIEDAGKRDSVYVYHGFYYDDVIKIDRSIELVDYGAYLYLSYPICITADEVILDGFNIHNSDMYIFIGIWLSASNCIISDNRISLSKYFGKGMYLTSSSNNIITKNKFVGNCNSIIIDTASCDNYIYHNNFVNSYEDHAIDNGDNIWDSGYPSGGNFWDDYDGTDSDGDGIGDTVYEIRNHSDDVTNMDRYPLMRQYVPPEITKPINYRIYIGNSELKLIPISKTLIVGKINVQVAASPGQNRVEFYIDEDLTATVTDEPYEWMWDERIRIFSKHNYTIKVIVYDTLGIPSSDEITVRKFF